MKSFVAMAKPHNRLKEGFAQHSTDLMHNLWKFHQNKTVWSIRWQSTAMGEHCRHREDKSSRVDVFNIEILTAATGVLRKIILFDSGDSDA